MAPSQTGETGGSGRKRLIVAAIVLTVLAALYSAGWHAAAERVKRRAVEVLTGLDAQGLSVDCRNTRVNGFPFRMELQCDRLDADDMENGISVALGAIRSAISLPLPWNVVSRIEGPAEIRSGAGLLLAEWETLETRQTFGLSGASRASLEGREMRASLATPTGGVTLQGTADSLSAFAADGGGDLLTGLTVENARGTNRREALALPPLLFDAALRVTGQAELLHRGRVDAENFYGTEGELERLAADLGEGRILTLSGPFFIDEAGRISGKFRLEAKRLDALAPALAGALPDQAEAIGIAAGILTSLAGGRTDLSLDITLRQGRVFVGFIPLGEIPPL